MTKQGITMANKGIKTMKQVAQKVKPIDPAPTSLGATLGKLPKVSAATTVIKRKPKTESMNAFVKRRNKQGA